MINEFIQKFLINKKINSNILASFSLNILNALFRFIQVYVFTAFLPASDYALWIILLSILIFYSFVDLGVGNYLSNHLLKINISENQNQFFKYFKFGKKIINFSILFTSLLTIILYFLIDFKDFFNFDQSQLQKFYIIFFILFIGSIFQTYASYYFNILRSLNLMDKALMINSFYIFIQIILFYIITFIFKNLYLTSLFFIIPYIFLFFHYKRFLKKITINFVNDHIDSLIDKSKLFYGSISFVFISINHGILNFIPIFFINKFSSDNNLIDFYIYKSFVLYLIQFINIFNFSFSPFINISYHQNKNNYHKLIKKLFLITFFSLSIFCIFSIFFGNIFFYYWTNGQTDMSFNILILFIIFIIENIVKK